MKRIISFRRFELFKSVSFLSVVASIAVFGIYAVINGSSRVYASPALPPNAVLMEGQLWMIKSNDLAIIGNMGTYEWVGCGLTTAPLTVGNYTACKPGQDPIYTSEASIANDISSGKLASGSTIIYDNETWTYTPAVEQQNPSKYEDQAVALTKAHNITIIATPYASVNSNMIAEEVTDAKAGANVVEIQAQTRDKDPTKYKALVTEAVNAIRAVNPNVLILTGLATDNGGEPTTAATLYKDYQDVKGIVNGFWLNADTQGTEGCSPQGCPIVARGFLNEIGVPYPGY